MPAVRLVWIHYRNYPSRRPKQAACPYMIMKYSDSRSTISSSTKHWPSSQILRIRTTMTDFANYHWLLLSPINPNLQQRIMKWTGDWVFERTIYSSILKRSHHVNLATTSIKVDISQSQHHCIKVNSLIHIWWMTFKSSTSFTFQRKKSSHYGSSSY